MQLHILNTFHVFVFPLPYGPSVGGQCLLLINLSCLHSRCYVNLIVIVMISYSSAFNTIAIYAYSYNLFTFASLNF